MSTGVETDRTPEVMPDNMFGKLKKPSDTIIRLRDPEYKGASGGVEIAIGLEPEMVTSIQDAERTLADAAYALSKTAPYAEELGENKKKFDQAQITLITAYGEGLLLNIVAMQVGDVRAGAITAETIMKGFSRQCRDAINGRVSMPDDMFASLRKPSQTILDLRAQFKRFEDPSQKLADDSPMASGHYQRAMSAANSLYEKALKADDNNKIIRPMQKAERALADAVYASVTSPDDKVLREQRGTTILQLEKAYGKEDAYTVIGYMAGVEDDHTITASTLSNDFDRMCEAKVTGKEYERVTKHREAAKKTQQVNER